MKGLICHAQNEGCKSAGDLRTNVRGTLILGCTKGNRGIDWTQLNCLRPAGWDLELVKGQIREEGEDA